jgi:hypothetical protein
VTKGIIIQRGYMNAQKGKILPITTMRAQRGSKYITILCPNIGARLIKRGHCHRPAALP